MKSLTLEQFNDLMSLTSIKPRLKSELRFVTSTSGMSEQQWRQTELLSITDRSGNNGVLLIAPDDDMFVIPYELSSGIASKQTGRPQPVTCDFCLTWQSGTRAASIIFPKVGKEKNTVGFLCCGDLACSQHVRSLTSAAKMSRAQIRENLTNEQRTDRLKVRLRKIVSDLQLSPVRTTE